MATTTDPQKQADDWNQEHPVGTAVKLRRDDGVIQQTATRTEAFVAHSGDAVIFLEGISGYYLLDRVAADDWVDVPDLRTKRDLFNAACPRGSNVCVRGSDGRGVITTIRSMATILGSGEVVVWLSDRTGSVPIDRITPLTASAGAA